MNPTEDSSAGPAGPSDADIASAVDQLQKEMESPEFAAALAVTEDLMKEDDMTDTAAAPAPELTLELALADPTITFDAPTAAQRPILKAVRTMSRDDVDAAWESVKRYAPHRRLPKHWFTNAVALRRSQLDEVEKATRAKHEQRQQAAASRTQADSAATEATTARKAAQAAKVERVLELRREGKTFTQIAEAVGLKTPQAVSSIIGRYGADLRGARAGGTTTPLTAEQVAELKGIEEKYGRSLAALARALKAAS